jgi:hypothetical protein
MQTMRTDDLIAALARDPVPALPSVGRLLLRALSIALPAALVLQVLVLGLRDDLADELTGWLGLKLALVAALGACGWVLTRASAQPGRDLPLVGLAAFATMLLAAILADLAIEGAGWADRLAGDNAVLCLVSVPFLSALPLAAMLYAVRQSAPLRPALAGAAAGLLAGSIGAFAYGLHCTDDSPLFLALWYLAGVSLVALAGAGLGQRLLRW